jgi:hypothetical protein
MPRSLGIGCQIVAAMVLLLSGIAAAAVFDQNSPGKVDLTIRRGWMPCLAQTDSDHDDNLERRGALFLDSA